MPLGFNEESSVFAMSHNLNYKFNHQNPVPRGLDDCRLTQAQTGPYITSYSQVILNPQNSTHDMNKSLPAAPTGMYPTNPGAIPGQAPQHHQPGMGGPAQSAGMVQGQQQMNHRSHMPNMSNFQPRTNPQIQSISRPTMSSIVPHAAPQGSQTYHQPLQNVMLSSHAHHQFQQMFLPQVSLFQQPRSMQYPIQNYSPMYTTPFYNAAPPSASPTRVSSNSPDYPINQHNTGPNGARLSELYSYFPMPHHVPSCPPPVNNMPPPSQPAPAPKRDRKILMIIDPETGKNVMDDFDTDSSRDSSRSASIHSSKESSRPAGPDSDVCSTFAAQVAAAAVAKPETQDSEGKGIGDAPSLIKQESLNVVEIPNDSGNGEILVLSDQFIDEDEIVTEHENSSIQFSKKDRLDSNSIIDNIPIANETVEEPEYIEPAESESYKSVNHDTFSPPVELPPQEFPALLHNRLEETAPPEVPQVSETVSDVVEIVNLKHVVEIEPIINSADETAVVNEQIEIARATSPSPPIETQINNKSADSLTSTALKTEKSPSEGRKGKGKKKKENINRKGESKEGSEMDAFLGASEAETLATEPTPASSPPAPAVSVPDETPLPTSPPSPPLPPVVNHEVTESIPLSNSLVEQPVETDDSGEVSKESPSPVEEPEDAKETSVPNAAQENSKAPTALKYTYKEDQWSPLNPEGKKHYDREFLLQMQSQPISMKKPLNLPNLEVIRDKAQLHKLTDVNRAPIAPVRRPYADPFMPNYAQSGISRTSPHGIPRRSQQGPKPKKVISFSSSLNQAVKLHESTNAWKPPMYSKQDIENDEDLKNQDVYKKVRGILNKLTPQKFNTLVKQVKDLEINTEERLKGVIDLVFEKAIDEPNFSVPYAAMCKQLALLKVPMSGQEGCVNFRKLLLTKCQKEFEQDKSDELKRFEKMKLIEDSVTEEKTKQLREEFADEERKNRRRQLGNIRFIGELFKLGMLIEPIMHECIKKLLHQGDEDSLECLCRLLSTIGKDLEARKEKEALDDFNAKKSVISGYFDDMQKVVDKRQTSSRVRFMLQDVIELKKRSWVPRRDDNAPKTIDQIHEEAEREHHEQQQMLQNMPFSSKRPPDDRRKAPNRNPNYEDGWITTSKASKANYSLDPQKLLLSKPAEIETIQLGPANRGFFNWGRGSSGGNKLTNENDKSSDRLFTNRYSALSDHSVPAPSYEGRRNSQRSAASSRESSRGRNSQLPPPSIRKTPSTSKERENVLEMVNRMSRTGQPEQKTTEPKVPTVVSNVNGKEPPAVLLRGSEMLEEEIEKKTRPLIDEFLSNGDFKEAVRCITELASPNTVHMVIMSAINQVLERSSQARYLLGQLLHNLVQTKMITFDQYNKGLKPILENLDDYALDIPMIWDYLAEIMEPMLEGNGIPLSFLEETLQPCVPSDAAGKLVIAVLNCASKKRGTIKVGEMWRDSGLEWSRFLPPSENLPAFIKTHKVEYTVSQTVAQPSEEMSSTEIKKNLDFYLKNDAENNDQIFDWIEGHLSDRTSEPAFIRALVTAVLESAISGAEEKCELNTEKLKNRMNLISNYVAHKDGAELQALYALQALIQRLGQPKGILNQIFDTLYDEEVINEETFYKWEVSEDPAEQEGKGVALGSVNSFFTWLREAENESSAEDG